MKIERMIGGERKSEAFHQSRQSITETGEGIRQVLLLRVAVDIGKLYFNTILIRKYIYRILKLANNFKSKIN